MNHGSSPHDDELRHANQIDAICDAFEKAWLADDQPQLEDYLSQVDDAHREQLFVELFRLDLDYRRARGTAQSQDELLERFPDFAEHVRQYFMQSTMVGEPHLEATLAAPQGQGRKPPQVLIDLQGTFGDYDVGEKLGVGGMGIVYRARQRSAQRDVALKVIRSDRLSMLSSDEEQTAVQRFRTEAQAAAALDHDGIVTVYDVGEIAGRHFFSMRLVQGESLSAIVQQGPLDNRRAADYIEQVSRAVQAAHEAGVLHRDLKPQNILVDDVSDRALVADFGLAKLRESSSELTRYGEIMGTPQYMSPEQAADAASVTALTDVYALGATLYHLITGRPPFHAATAMETLQQVARDDPAQPRRLNPAIDRDLETICLKCLEKEPARRYPSAAMLGDELQRYLKGEPIQARHLGPVARTWRWCRRRPLPASLAAVAALFLLVAIITTAVGYARTARAQRASEEGFRDARLALDQVVMRIRDEELVNQPQIRQLREDLLRQALRYYETFLAKRASDPAIREEVAATYYRVGLIYEDILTAEKAVQAYRQAAELQLRLVRQEPQNIKHLAALGSTYNALGRACNRQPDVPAAIQAFQDAVNTREQLVAATPSADRELLREHQRMLVNSHMNLGILRKQQGEFDAARAHFETAQTSRKQMLQQDAADRAIRRDFGIGFYNLATLALSRDDDETARKHLRQANEQFQMLMPLDDAAPNTVYSIAVSLRAASDLEEDYEPAAKGYRDARKLLDPLAQSHPDVLRYREELARLQMNLGQLESDVGNADAALVELDKARALLEDLRRLDDSTAAYLRNLAITHQEMARVQLDLEQDADARRHLLQAAQLLEQLVKQAHDEEDRLALEDVRKMLLTASP